jgi:leader peptidase (prepilin peptidase)/N-methyltransferase
VRETRSESAGRVPVPVSWADNVHVTPAELTLLTPLLYVFVGGLGALIGSFVNVVIWRVPQGLSIVRPGSACPKCGHQITALENIPVVSWLALRGRCSGCRSRISVRYPLVEAAVSALFILMAWTVGFTPILPLWLYLAAAGTALFLIDIDCQRLPDAIVWPSWVVTLVCLGAAAMFTTGGADHLAHAGWGALTFGVVYALIYFGSMLFYAGGGMGRGDLKLAPVLGAALGWFGWGSTLVGLMSAFFIGGAVSVGLIMFSKLGRKSKVPHGPFMLAGTLVGLLFGPWLWDWYLTFSGLA